MSRPSMSRPSISRPSPSISRPSMSRPSISRPTTRPSMPSSRPSISRPSMPSTRPSLPSSRPSTRPSMPSTRPSLPSTSRPSLPSTRPSTRPSLPSSRPSLPSTRPGTGRPVTGRPSQGRPTQGQLNDFLNLDRPSTLPGVRPGGGAAGDFLQNRPSTRPAPGTRPGVGDRPSTLPETRPGIGDRPSTRPSPGTRPGAGDRPGIGDWTPQRFLRIGLVGVIGLASAIDPRRFQKTGPATGLGLVIDRESVTDPFNFPSVRRVGRIVRDNDRRAPVPRVGVRPGNDHPVGGHRDIARRARGIFHITVADIGDAIRPGAGVG